MTRLLNPQGVAEYLGISRAQLYALGILDQLAAVRVGKVKKYDQRDVDAWIEGAKETNRRNHR